MTGDQWEEKVALENQRLYDVGRAMIVRVPTHYFSHPSKDPKVDFVGLLDGGRMVAVEAKAESGGLTKMQRAYLRNVARFGGVAIVYRCIDGERHVCPVDTSGKMQRKSSDTLCKGTWLDWVEENYEND